MESTTQFHDILRALCSNLEIPVIIVLLVLAAFTILLVGSVIAEAIFEHRHLKAKMPVLVDELRVHKTPVPEIIRLSGLLRRQKIALLELTRHQNLTEPMRDALALRLLTEECTRYERIVKVSDIIVRLGPVFGLLGTLIPLGPGIIALGRGDTVTLSTSLLTAFDTTIVGLLCSAISAVISIIRNQWYKNYMSVLETLIECILEVMKTDGGATERETGKQQ